MSLLAGQNISYHLISENIFKLSTLFVLTKPLIMFQSIEINSIYTDVFEVN